MKNKIRLTILAVAFAVVFISCDKDTPEDLVAPEANRCNTNTPGWGESLGVVSFVSDIEWEIKDNEGVIKQIWSDAIQAANCSQKTNFYGGDLSTQNFNADCRSNPNRVFRGDTTRYGDLFSWCAVARFGNELCPGNWRVPTQEEMMGLDTLLGSNGRSTSNGSSATHANTIAAQELRTKYLEDWGAKYGGTCNTVGVLSNQNVWGFYWTQLEGNSTSSRGLHVGSTVSNSTVVINPQLNHFKFHGFTLRCIRDVN